MIIDLGNALDIIMCNIKKMMTSAKVGIKLSFIGGKLWKFSSSDEQEIKDYCCYMMK